MERAPDPRDGRAVLIRATSAAGPGFRLARARLAEIDREWQGRLGGDRLDGLAEVLRELEQHEAGRQRACD